MNPRVLYRAASYATDARSAADSVISALSPAAWYRNATDITESGGFVSQWGDYSGNGRHLVQGTGTNQPAYSAGVLTFDGLDNFMSAAFVLPSPVTAVMVVKQVSWTANDRILDGYNVDTSIIRQVTASPQIEAWGGSSYTSNSSDLAVGARGIVLRVWDGASSVLRVNNGTEITDGSGTISTTGGITLGARGGGGSEFSNIAVEELVVFNSALSLANRNSVITALNNALTVF